MHMATKPRITVSLEDLDYQALRRVSDAYGQSMSSLICELVSALRPALVRLAEVGEAAAAAKPEVLDQLRAVSDEGDRLLGPLLTAGMAGFDQVTNRMLETTEK